MVRPSPEWVNFANGQLLHLFSIQQRKPFANRMLCSKVISLWRPSPRPAGQPLILTFVKHDEIDSRTLSRPLVKIYILHYTTSDFRSHLTLALIRHFATHGLTGGELIRPPPRVWPLIELATRDKNERVGRHETKRLVPILKVVDQPVTSEVRSRGNLRYLGFGYLLLNYQTKLN